MENKEMFKIVDEKLTKLAEILNKNVERDLLPPRNVNADRLINILNTLNNNINKIYILDLTKIYMYVFNIGSSLYVINKREADKMINKEEKIIDLLETIGIIIK